MWVKNIVNNFKTFIAFNGLKEGFLDEIKHFYVFECLHNRNNVQYMMIIEKSRSSWMTKIAQIIVKKQFSW